MSKEKEEEKYTWMPSIKWLAVTLATIYVIVIVLFFLFNFLLKDYMRDIPEELTPWLNNQTATEKK